MKQYYWLLGLWLGCANVLLAQSATTIKGKRLALKYFSEEYRQKTSSEWRRTLTLAEKNGWPIREIYTNGRTIVLQGVDFNGLPIYYATHHFSATPFSKPPSNLLLASLPSLNGSSKNVINRLGVWDDGKAFVTHRELSGRIKTKESSGNISEHTTHIAGIMIGAGINPIVKSTASGANLNVWDFNNDIAEMAQAAPELLLSNHSYGVQSGWVFNPNRLGTDDNEKWEWWGDDAISTFEDYKLGYYDTKARDLDRIAFLAPNYLIVKSADNKRGETGPPDGTPYFIRNTLLTSTALRHRNDAYGTIPMEANAKNILTVGAVFPPNKANPQPNDIQMTYFSSWGPTDDGRIKPDLVASGIEITSSSARANDAYAIYSGTSVAAPQVAAGLLPLQEYYAKLNFGFFMQAATLKGLAIHTADEAGKASGPDYEFGWGLLNTQRAMQVIDNQEQNHSILENSLAQGSAYSINVVASGQGPLKVTISWTDPEATPISAYLLNSRLPRLINDLDIRISDGSETSLPWTLNPDVPSQPAVPGDNLRDNVEQVLISTPVAGKTYTILVSHKGVLKNSYQDFSLIMSGISQTGCQLTAGISPNGSLSVCSDKALRLNANTGSNYRYQWMKEGIDLPNNTAYYLNVSESGRYQVRITHGDCQATAPAVNVSISQVKASVAASGSTNLCNGTSVLLNANSGTTYTYQWLRNGNTIAGANLGYYLANQSGSYQVQVKEGSCSVTSTAINVIGNTISVSINPSSDAILCGAGPIVFSTNVSSSYAYQWFKDGVAVANANNAIFYAWQAGSYTVKVSVGNCSGLSKTVQVSDNSFTAGVFPSGTLSLCSGGSTVLSCNTGSDFAYQWLKNGQKISRANLPVLVVKEAGAYVVSITKGICSVSSSAVNVVLEALTANIIPQSTTTFYQGGAVTLQANTGSNLSYQWYRDNIAILGATDAIYKATQSGNYAIKILQNNCSITSSPIQVTVIPLGVKGGRLATEITENEQNSILRVFPNPASTTLTVEFQSSISGEAPVFTLYDAIGRSLQTQTLLLQSDNLFSAEISLNLLMSGTYFVRVIQGERSFVKGFAKQ